MGRWGDSRSAVERSLDDHYRRLRSLRIVTDALIELREIKRAMSLKGKMAALTERAVDFNTATEKALDGIAEKIAAAERKREEAVPKHHGYYDGIIRGIDDSVAVIDRLSNGPLDGDGKG